MIQIKVTFETREEAIAWLENSDCKETKETKTKKETPKETPKGTPKETKTKKEPKPEKVRDGLVDKIRGFILQDKTGNMRKILPLMPEGTRDIRALSLEQAQSICLELGIE